jgi:glycosyltransferase involved in cell wall biosynthesis
LAARLRGALIHFDVADPFDLAKPVPFKRFFRWLEWWVAKHADLVTVSHASRLGLYGRSVTAAQVVENVPLLPFTQQNRKFLEDVNGQAVITFGYFGTLETHRGLEDIVKLAMENEAVCFKVGGRGALESFIRKASASCSRIEFVGEYLPADLPGLTRGVDVYCSLYYSSKPLHRYAAPNKFFEHLALGLPVLMSANTPYAKDVVECETGWVIEDGYEPLQDWFTAKRLYKSAFEGAAENAQKKWQRDYQNWLTQQKDKLLAFTM